MKKQELIALAKELSELSDLKGREQDLFFLKREYNRLNSREEETFYEKNLTDEFNSYFEKLGSRVSELTRSSFDDKKELIKKARELVSSDNNIKNLNKAINDLFNELKRLPKCSKEQDDEIFAEFKEIRQEANKKVDAYFNNVKATIASRKEKKQELISKAKEVLKMENIKNATSEMDKLMNEWKQVGFAGKEDDESLWNEFREVRHEFQEKRKAHFENMQKVFEDRAIKKEELIKKVKYITSEAYFTPEEIKEIKGLDSEFRKIGFAGKEKDQLLFDEMQAAVRKYFEEMKFYK